MQYRVETKSCADMVCSEGYAWWQDIAREEARKSRQGSKTRKKGGKKGIERREARKEKKRREEGMEERRTTTLCCGGFQHPQIQSVRYKPKSSPPLTGTGTAQHSMKSAELIEGAACRSCSRVESRLEAILFYSFPSIQSGSIQIKRKSSNIHIVT